MEIARTMGSTTYYYHSDGIGSVRLESTSSGGNYFSSNYKPYGPQYGSSGSETFRYVDKPYDTTTGLYCFGARFYDSTTGRFLTRDPSSGTRSDPQSLNAYAYARDNPLTITDPTGRVWWNPLTWTPTNLVLVAAVVGLTALNIAQFGLDLGTDALEVGAISELTATFAATDLAVSTVESASKTIDVGLGDATATARPAIASLLTNLDDLEIGPRPSSNALTLENSSMIGSDIITV